MSLDIVENRLKEYQPKTKQEEINALKEICQEIALCGLARSEFFKKGAFQGDTCLRILYGLKRFSEDLDFILFKTAASFTTKAGKPTVLILVITHIFKGYFYFLIYKGKAL